LRYQKLWRINRTPMPIPVRDTLIEAGKVTMVVLAVLGGVVIVGIVSAAVWDRKQRRRGAGTEISRSDIEIREGQRWPMWPDDHE
jgi:hypothetical protein